jgi:hypothetical protein
VGERCRKVVYAHVRDGGRRYGRYVCEAHVAWAQQEIARLGYQPLVIRVNLNPKATAREITSGCEAPKGLR